MEVLRDSLGVPHVWAGSLADAVFAQGYLHATDRLWQLEMFRRVAQGRLSELFGEETLDADRFLRTLGLARAGQETAVSTGTRALAEAYARGVNAAVDEWRGLLPPEFVLVRATFEPWALEHSLAVEKTMAWDLSQYGISMSLASARAAAGDEAVLELLPSYPDWGVTILQDGPGVPGALASTGASRSGPPAAPSANDASITEPDASIADRPASRNPLPPTVSADLVASARMPAAARTALEAASIVRASNSWVVGGSRTRSGRPLVANDMHLGLDHPNIWYLIGLHAPGLDVVGQSLPGAPGVIAGHTAGVAWGFTNAMVDDSDFFIERVDPADTTRYLTPEGSEPFGVREEAIRVRGRDQPVRLLVRETRHGPVMTAVDPVPGGELLSFRWGAHDPSTTFDGILAMNLANSASELIAALGHFTSPYQNVVFADTAGDFGYQLAGAVPLRRSGRPPLLPVPGWTGEHDWVGTLPYERNPRLLNPTSGFIATANNRQSRDSLSLLISPDRWEDPYRAQRITELIEARGDHDAESMRTIQLDVQSGFIARYRGRASAAFRRVGLDSLAGALDAWDGRATVESTEATLFHAWAEALRTGMRARFHMATGGSGYFPQYMVGRGLDAGGAGVDALAGQAALEAAGASGRPWGQVHLLRISHPFQEVPLIGGLLGFGRRDLPRAGDDYTVDAAPFEGNLPLFEVTAGPSQRSIVDLGDLGRGGVFILPGGQSGRPANRHSWDQLERWQRGELWRLPLDRSEVEARTISRLRLLPG
ncbi:MAG: penicillin acylase family protein [Gammaproteobacteria bacterium]|nr:penicillin acylase family protein [Gammaproteobacteria bacterium]